MPDANFQRPVGRRFTTGLRLLPRRLGIEPAVGWVDALDARPFIPRLTRLGLAGLGLILLSLTTLGASAASPKRVLILNPFARDVAPFSAAVSSFRSTLVQELGEPVDLYEVPLDLARFAGPEGEDPLVAFLEGRLKGHPVDLVVPIGGAGAGFVARHRERLFPHTPLLFTAADRRLVPPDLLRRDATLVTQAINLRGMVEDILQLQPQTTNIVVVFGASPLERFWISEARREFQVFADRVKFTWVDDLSAAQILERCATLPPHSFILHVLFLIDATGAPSKKNEMLRRLHEVANSPQFGFFESEFGLGPVGGRLYQDHAVGRLGGRTAIRILHGESPGSIPPQELETPAPVYDWRELQRWGISQSRLPAGSKVEFYEPGFWARYPWSIAGTILFCALQAALITGLLVNRMHRRRGEAEAVLIADISSKFVNIPSVEVDQEITSALRRICEFLKIDMAAIWQWSGGPTGSYRLTHLDSAPVDPAKGAPMSEDDFPWVRQQMLAGRIVSLSSLDELPAEAVRDRDTARQMGIKSTLTISLMAGGGYPLGVLGFNAIRAERDWPDALVQRLQLVAQIFTNALERKQADIALRADEVRLRGVIESTSNGILVLDLKGRIVIQNSHFAEMWRLSGDLPATDGRNALLAHVLGQVSNPEGFLATVRTLSGSNAEDAGELLLKDGRVFAYLSRPLVVQGAVEGRVWSFQDLTAQKQSEREILQHRNQLTHLSRVTMLGELAGSLAHELNQPLTAILSNAQAAQRFLARTPLDLTEMGSILTDIVAEDVRAGEVIRRLRLLLKKGEVMRQPLVLDTVINDALRLLRSDLVSHGVSLKLDFGRDLPAVEGDRVQLQQVLLNLVLNACDAMAGGAPGERLLTIRTAASGDAVSIEVIDCGEGIAMEQIDQIFEPFYTTKAHGLGMGLSVCRTIVTAHGGKLWVSRTPDRGVTFHCTLPTGGKRPVASGT